MTARVRWLALTSMMMAASSAEASDLSLRIVDAATSAAIPAARISVGGRTLAADAEGRAAVPLGPGRWTVTVGAPGYVDRSLEVDAVEAPAAQPLEIALVPRDRFREKVEVSADAGPAQRPPAATPVKPAEVAAVAGGLENVFRVLQTLPGVASPEDFSSRIAVRGGGPDENLTVMDGVEIHNPYRLFGLVSAFNPETVDSFVLTAGGFGAAYGDRLSSLLVVRNRAGTSERALTGSGALSLTDANVVLEGRTPRTAGSWLVSGRRTYYDLVAERFTDQDLPSFADLQAKSVLPLGTGRTLSLFSLRSRESTDASFDVPKEGAEGAIFTRSRNDLYAASFEANLGARAAARTIASAYTNTDSVDFGGSFRNRGRRSNAPGDEAFATSRVELTWDGSVRDVALRQELSLQAGRRHLLEAGVELHRLRTGVRFTIPGERNPTEANTSSLAGGAGLPDDLDSARRDTRVGAWLQDRLSLSARLSLEGGLRFDRSTVNARASLSPRLSATYAPAPRWRVRAALGLYTQSPGYEKLVQSDYFMDLTGAGPLPLASERSRHVLVSLERDLPGGVLARVEAYHKRFDRLVIGRLETPEETAARIAAYDFPAELADGVPREPWITTFPTNDGRGSGRGFDLYLARPARSAATRLHGWASYTYGVAEREAYGRTLPFDYDRRHAASLVASLRLSSKLVLATTARFASGFPRTPVRGLRVAAVADRGDADGDGNRDELVPERDREGRLVYTTDLGGVADLNSARLPHYARVDTRLTWTPGGPGGRVQLYLDAINVLARDNAGLLEPELEYDPGADRPRLVEKPSGSIPFLPSFGVHVDFTRPRRGGRVTGDGAAAPSSGRWAVSARPLGSQGIGLDVFRALAPRVNARAGFGLPSTFSFAETASGTGYDVKLALGGGHAGIDWHPFGGGFHLGGGILRTRHRFTLAAQPAAELDLGGRRYAASEVGALAGTAAVRQWLPYVGLGWGNPLGRGKRFGLVLDLGVAPQGRPAVALSASGPAAEAAGFADRLGQEAQDVERRLAGWRLFPVVSLGISRRF